MNAPQAPLSTAIATASLKPWRVEDIELFGRVYDTAMTEGIISAFLRLLGSPERFPMCHRGKIHGPQWHQRMDKGAGETTTAFSNANLRQIVFTGSLLLLPHNAVLHTSKSYTDLSPGETGSNILCSRPGMAAVVLSHLYRRLIGTLGWKFLVHRRRS